MTDAAAKSQDYVWDGTCPADREGKLLIVVVDADGLPGVAGGAYPSGQIGCVFIKTQV